MAGNEEKVPDSLIFNEVQLLLAEKTTSLAIMRTGIAVFAIPLSIFSFLILTSKYYEVVRVLHWLFTVITINSILIILGAYLVLRAIIRIQHFDKCVRELKKKHSILAEFIE